MASGPSFSIGGESGLEFLATLDPDSVDRGSGRFAAKLDLFEERFEEGIGRVRQGRHATRRWQHVADQLDTFASQFGCHGRQAGDVSATNPLPIGSVEFYGVRRASLTFVFGNIFRSDSRKEAGHE
jgi:hypothetical protein